MHERIRPDPLLRRGPRRRSGRAPVLPYALPLLCLLALAAGCRDRGPVSVDGDEPGAQRSPPRGASGAQGLAPMFSLTGGVYVSVDGFGTVEGSGRVEVEKRPGATVRHAFLAAATQGYSRAALANGDLRIGGAPVVWQQEVPGAVQNVNQWAEVTSLVRPLIDAAPPGRVTVTVTQLRPLLSEGIVLAVVFDDPALPPTSSVVLFFGAQPPEGEEFTVPLAEPLANPADPGLTMLLGLGISYGFQPGAQVTLVDVNDRRLTSSAGGQRDTQGRVVDGALFTVGGVGDSPTNPEPHALATSTSTDDELYDLRPLLRAGEREIRVRTLNPTDDDNLFFAYFALSVRGGIDLPPEARIDVEQPGSPPRTIDHAIKRQGLSQLAIVTLFATPTLNPDDVDIAALRLGDGIDPDAAPNRWETGAIMFEWRDVDGDGRRDLRVAFCLCDVPLPTATPTPYTLVLRGRLNDGRLFRGTREVTVIGRP
jgi:hypothetical protein